MFETMMLMICILSGWLSRLARISVDKTLPSIVISIFSLDFRTAEKENVSPLYMYKKNSNTSLKIKWRFSNIIILHHVLVICKIYVQKRHKTVVKGLFELFFCNAQTVVVQPVFCCPKLKRVAAKQIGHAFDPKNQIRTNKYWPDRVIYGVLPYSFFHTHISFLCLSVSSKRTEMMYRVYQVFGQA